MGAATGGSATLHPRLYTVALSGLGASLHAKTLFPLGIFVSFVAKRDKITHNRKENQGIIEKSKTLIGTAEGTGGHEQAPKSTDIDVKKAEVMLAEASRLRSEIARLAFDLDGINKSIAYLSNALARMAQTVEGTATAANTNVIVSPLPC